MELELGLKITHTREDLTSTTDLRITKDSSGPLFFSKEIDTMFFLIVHLKGFRRENIDIKINEGGNHITISGTKPVQEMVLVGWIMCKKEVELRAFKKVFRIPDGVILDKIKAKFNEEESTLKIIMPKLVKGICGVEIEEVKEEEVDRGRPERERTVETKKMEDIDQVVEKEVIRRYPEMTQVVADKVPEKGYRKEKTAEPKIDKKKETDGIVEEKVDRVESKATETAADEVHERAGEALEKEAKEPEVKKIVEKSQTIPEIEHSRGLEKATRERTEPPATTKSKEVEAKSKVDRAHKKELLPTEGTPSVESAKTVADQVTQQSEVPNSSSAQAEEKLTTNENHRVEGNVPQELQKHESKKPETDQEPQKAVNNEIEEEQTDQGKLPEENGDDENEAAEMENQNGAAQPKKYVPKKSSKICAPLLVAGSAILVSLIAIVFHFIKAKKR